MNRKNKIWKEAYDTAFKNEFEKVYAELYNTEYKRLIKIGVDDEEAQKVANDNIIDSATDNAKSNANDIADAVLSDADKNFQHKLKNKK